MVNGYGDIFKSFRGDLLLNEPLSAHTSLRVGGPVDVFARPEDRDDLVELLAACRLNRIAWMVIGGGYNILMRDGGFRGVVISLKHLKGVCRLPGNRIQAQAGISNQRLVKFLETEGLSGLEFLCGIPGTVGGALAVNAGCHGHEIMDTLQNMNLVCGESLSETSVENLIYGYRYLNLPAGAVVVDAVFQLAADDPTAITVRVQDFLEKRRLTQKVSYPNAGSFFKNPPSTQAWRLIDAAGLRGFSVGGAKVSEQHANFLVNTGSATANDFLSLAEIIKERVRSGSGIELQEEVRISGEELNHASLSN